jgi:hypothetical protein
MKPIAIDLSFLFPYPQGHYACICSRCLSRITKQDITFCMLKPNSLLAFEEYRYCADCQRQAGCTPCRSTDPVLARLSKEIRENPRFRTSKIELESLVRTARANRTKLVREKEKEKAREEQSDDPWAIPGFLMPLAIALGKARK